MCIQNKLQNEYYKPSDNILCCHHGINLFSIKTQKILTMFLPSLYECRKLVIWKGVKFYNFILAIKLRGGRIDRKCHQNLFQYLLVRFS